MALLRQLYIQVLIGIALAVALGVAAPATAVEMKPLGVKVATIMVGAVETKLFDNAPEHHLPQGSIYRPAEKEISDWARAGFRRPVRQA